MILSVTQFLSAEETWEKVNGTWEVSDKKVIRRVNEQRLLEEKSFLQTELRDIQKKIDQIDADLDKIKELGP